MKLRQPYKQHARRHLPGGSDPLQIPSGGISFCYAQTVIRDMATDGNPTYLSHATIFGSSQFVTNDPSAFSEGTRTIVGNSYTGVSFEKAGVYLGFSDSQVISGLTAGDDVFFTRDPGGDVTPSFWLGGLHQAKYLTTFWSSGVMLSNIEAYQVDAGTTPTEAIIMKCANNTGNRGELRAAVMYVYLGAGTLF